MGCMCLGAEGPTAFHHHQVSVDKVTAPPKVLLVCDLCRLGRFQSSTAQMVSITGVNYQEIGLSPRRTSFPLLIAVRAKNRNCSHDKDEQ